MILGLIFREDITSHVQKLINISQAQLGFIQFLDGFGGFPVNTNTKALFGCADKPPKKHCWLIYCEKKHCFS
jgi:hypothetical protein